MQAGVRPSEFWDLTFTEYNLIIEAHRENQKAKKYNDIAIAYYTGCFVMNEKAHDLYNDIINGIDDSSPQTGAEMFNFLKNKASMNQDNILDTHFKIPLKLIPEFKVDVYSYIFNMQDKKLELYLPDVVLSINNSIVKPVKGNYVISEGHLKEKSNIMKIKYNDQVYTVVIVLE